METNYKDTPASAEEVFFNNRHEIKKQLSERNELYAQKNQRILELEDLLLDKLNAAAKDGVHENLYKVYKEALDYRDSKNRNF